MQYYKISQKKTFVKERLTIVSTFNKNTVKESMPKISLLKVYYLAIFIFIIANCH